MTLGTPLTIFCLPKAFAGATGILQRNAIRSWMETCPVVDIILVGDDAGVAEVAREFGLRYIQDLERNRYGTPLLDGVFAVGQKAARYTWVAYVNADIILTSSFWRGFQSASRAPCLVIGRRWDLDVTDSIDFSDSEWECKLIQSAAARGRLHEPTGIDYLIFPRSYQHGMPPFAVGRPGWDNWFVYRAQSLCLPVVDASDVITVIHQNHGYLHHPGGLDAIWFGPEAEENRKLLGGAARVFTIEDADWKLSSRGWRKQAWSPGRVRRRLATLAVLGRLPAPMVAGLRLIARVESAVALLRGRLARLRRSGIGP